MEERKLNFSAPLLSVRRFSETSAFSDRDKQKIIENSPPTTRQSLPFCNSDVSLDQVTEPVAVPFVWEQIPGKVKGGIENEFQANKGASGTPRLPPGSLDVITYPVGKYFDYQNVVRLQTETNSMEDHVTKLDSSNEGMNEKCISESENDDDVYSDALDTLSPTDSISMNCSISSGTGAKPSGTFSTDPLTRDFMMSRFLPAAKAMTLAIPQYASRKQSMAPEQPREVKKVVDGDRKPPVNQYESIVIPHYNQDVDEEETEDEYEDYDDSGNLSRKACGLLPRLCFKNTLRLVNPVPGLKVRTHSSMYSAQEVVKPGKDTYMKSRSQIVEKHAWDVVHKNKSVIGVQSPRLPENKLDSAVQSPRLPEDKFDIGVQFPRLPEIGKKLTCQSNRFTSSNDQQIVNRSPPKKLPDGAHISPYRRARPQSPFRGGGFLGMPKEAEKFKANMLVKCTRSNNNSQEVVPYQSTRKGLGSLRPAVEKTLHVDTVNFAEIASSISNSSDTNVQTDSTGKHSDTSRANRMPEEPAMVESSLQDIKGLNLLDGKEISEYEITGSVNSSRSSFCDKPYLKVQAEIIDCFRQNGGLDQKSKSLERIKVRADANLTVNDDDDLRAADQEAKAGSYYSPLPPPLPKTPSESWLWRALPSATSRNSFSQSYNGTRFNPKKHEPKIPATDDTKWETIVKTSYLHHNHVRYSEELVTHFSQQSKT
ncbi:uncharacterized protein LOC111281333 [Durio zibethinus]|uniref:Uncharacterized protein LOC111281333 n=1 Tax=Durio zibethinus TaxID=66656 RepID=A0A6P5XB08_DURZI|nr:uncharacterized protein LOC111281333 [Durio zibethinus]XP_022724797.1 uncharacterized protein LOC111281333 [Durio zibethinus]XP_022724798.1 uncharacterized protein LOC111281333 [Durio zibethinus]